MTEKNEIQQVNDSFFHKIFDSPKNARDFLKRVLPPVLLKHLDLKKIEIGDTKYVSNEFDKGFSDIVVRTRLKKKNGKELLVDLYFLIEHKTEGRVELFLQFLKYLVFELEKDYNNGKPPRLIIPVLFYHGPGEWKVPLSFAEQFDVDDEIKQYLLDYRYILFDTNPWDFRNDSELKKNVFLFTAMALMKAAYKNDFEAILEIFRFWQEKGFTGKKEIVLFFLRYISQTQDIKPDQLKKILDKSNIHGGDIMPTLAQRFKEEFIETLGPQLIKKGKRAGKRAGKIAGKIAGKKEIAIQMLQRDFDLNTIMDLTGFTKPEIEKLTPHSGFH
jgi:predicted transposase/invertase (TIGR01784 family)